MSSGAGDGAPPSYEDVVKSNYNTAYTPAYGTQDGQAPPQGQAPYPPPTGQPPYPPPPGQTPTGQAPYPQQPTDGPPRPYPVQPPPPPGYGAQPNFICGAQPVNYGNNVYSGQPGVVTIQNTQGQVHTQPMGNYRRSHVFWSFVIFSALILAAVVVAIVVLKLS